MLRWSEEFTLGFFPLLAVTECARLITSQFAVCDCCKFFSFFVFQFHRTIETEQEKNVSFESFFFIACCELLVCVCSCCIFRTTNNNNEKTKCEKKYNKCWWYCSWAYFREERAHNAACLKGKRQHRRKRKWQRKKKNLEQFENRRGVNEQQHSKAHTRWHSTAQLSPLLWLLIWLWCRCYCFSAILASFPVRYNIYSLWVLRCLVSCVMFSLR